MAPPTLQLRTSPLSPISIVLFFSEGFSAYCVNALRRRADNMPHNHTPPALLRTYYSTEEGTTNWWIDRPTQTYLEVCGCFIWMAFDTSFAMVVWVPILKISSVFFSTWMDSGLLESSVSSRWGVREGTISIDRRGTCRPHLLRFAHYLKVYGCLILQDRLSQCPGTLHSG